jgi:TonB family protein
MKSHLVARMSIFTARILLWLCLFPSAFTPALWGQSHPDEEQLRAAYAGKIVTLRHFYSDTHLEFAPDGALKGASTVGPWTLDGQLLVNDVQLHEGKLRVQGRRLHLYYDSSSKDFRDYLTVIENLPEPERQKLHEAEKSLLELAVEIDIDLPTTPLDWPTLANSMNGVFRAPGESMTSIVPEYWRLYFAQKEGRPQEMPKLSAAKIEVVKPGGPVTPPVVTFHPDPSYEEQARKSKYQGTSVLRMVVAEDGSVRDLQILTPLGLGLDEKAVDAVKTWKFEPARRGDQPVAVIIAVEVDFKLY